VSPSSQPDTDRGDCLTRREEHRISLEIFSSVAVYAKYNFPHETS
jgi:hypothetical protein